MGVLRGHAFFEPGLRRNLTGQNTAESLSALQTSVGHAEAAIGLDRSSTEAIRLLAIDYNMAGSIEELHDPAGATPYFRQAVSAMGQITGPAPPMRRRAQ